MLFTTNHNFPNNNTNFLPFLINNPPPTLLFFSIPIIIISSKKIPTNAKILEIAFNNENNNLKLLKVNNPNFWSRSLVLAISLLILSIS